MPKRTPKPPRWTRRDLRLTPRQFLELDALKFLSGLGPGGNGKPGFSKLSGHLFRMPPLRALRQRLMLTAEGLHRRKRPDVARVRVRITAKGLAALDRAPKAVREEAARLEFDMQNEAADQ